MKSSVLNPDNAAQSSQNKGGPLNFYPEIYPEKSERSSVVEDSQRIFINAKKGKIKEEIKQSNRMIE